MKTLSTLKIRDLLPSSLASSQVVRDVAAACDVPLGAVTQRMSDLLIYSRIDSLDETAVDELAWQFHVDFYDADLSLVQKRSLVKTAIIDHKYKGTLYAVQRAATEVYDKCAVQEWPAYGGTAYHFRLALSEPPPSEADFYKRLIKAVTASKNVRSWLEEEITVHSTTRRSVYLGLARRNHLHVVVYPATSYRDTNADSVATTGMAMATAENIELREETSNV